MWIDGSQLLIPDGVRDDMVRTVFMVQIMQKAKPAKHGTNYPEHDQKRLRIRFEHIHPEGISLHCHVPASRTGRCTAVVMMMMVGAVAVTTMVATMPVPCAAAAAMMHDLVTLRDLNIIRLVSPSWALLVGRAP